MNEVASNNVSQDPLTKIFGPCGDKNSPNPLGGAHAMRVNGAEKVATPATEKEIVVVDIREEKIPSITMQDPGDQPALESHFSRF